MQYLWRWQQGNAKPVKTVFESIAVWQFENRHLLWSIENTSWLLFITLMHAACYFGQQQPEHQGRHEEAQTYCRGTAREDEGWNDRCAYSALTNLQSACSVSNETIQYIWQNILCRHRGVRMIESQLAPALSSLLAKLASETITFHLVQESLRIWGTQF